jgi:hypothetical protein
MLTLSKRAVSRTGLRLRCVPAGSGQFGMKVFGRQLDPVQLALSAG